MNNILVVCIGNICRSPMAEALLRRALPNRNIYSAGLGAMIGKPADPIATDLMAQREVQLEHHIAQQLSPLLVNKAELVLVMDREQKRYIENHYVAARGKIFLLGEASQKEIPDPYGEGRASFEHALELIDDGVNFWADYIARLS